MYVCFGKLLALVLVVNSFPVPKKIQTMMSNIGSFVSILSCNRAEPNTH